MSETPTCEYVFTWETPAACPLQVSINVLNLINPGHLAQSVTCMATDACLTMGGCVYGVSYLPTRPRSAVGNVSGNRCESDCRSRGREFDPGPVPYFLGD